jgi:methylmalonyl-CoA mutase cobalamin-binding domain/chain
VADVLEEVADALEELREDTVDVVQRALEHGADPLAIVERGIVLGIQRCGDKLAAYEYGVPELMVAGEIAEECIAVVRPHLSPEQAQGKGTVVIATVQGDIHELGKNLVALFLELAGYRVTDLGVDASPMAIIEAAAKAGADVIGLSSLMVTTMPAQQEVLTYLRDLGKREEFKVMIGGAPTTAEWAAKIGADGWAPDAQSAVRLVDRLVAAAPGAARPAPGPHWAPAPTEPLA